MPLSLLLPMNVMIQQRYTIQNFLGEGNQAQVWKMENGEGLFYTIKIFFPSAPIGDLWQKISIVQRISHDHIVPILEYGLLPYHHEDGKVVPTVHQDQGWWGYPARPKQPAPQNDTNNMLLYMVMPYAEETFETLDNVSDIEEFQRIEMALQLALGLRKIHSYQIPKDKKSTEPFFHGNLAPSNILVYHKPNGHKIVRIADVGLATSHSYHSEISPEQDKHLDMDYHVDLFTLGRILAKWLHEPHPTVTSLLGDLQKEDPFQRPDLGSMIVALWNERKRLHRNQLAHTIYLLGVLLFQKGQFDYAQKDFEKAILLNPDFTSAWIYKGNTLKELGQYEDALMSYNKAIALDENNSLAYEGRGELHGEQQEYEKAISDFEKAITLDPEAVSAYGSLGIVYSQLKQWDRALIQYDKLLSIRQDFALAYIDRGDVLMELQQYPIALEDYRKALELQSEESLLQKIKDCESKIANYSK